MKDEVTFDRCKCLKSKRYTCISLLKICMSNKNNSVTLTIVPGSFELRIKTNALDHKAKKLFNQAN